MGVQELLKFLMGFWWLLAKIFYSLFDAAFRTVVGVEEKPVKGEIVLITGTGHGMGKELALLYASKGATVVGLDINEDTNIETLRKIEEIGCQKAYFYKCDVSSKDNVFSVAQKIQSEVGDVTILINNAGIMPTHSLLEHTKTEIENIFGINVLAHIWTIQAFLPTMKKNNKGHIVALSSCAGLFGLPNLVPYSASKFAVFGMMESLYEELRTEDLDIQVTTVCPYMVDTGLCKKPIVKYQNLMPLLSPKEAAEEIMKAQRRNQRILTMPGYFSTLTKYTRLLPVKAAMYVRDFVGAGVESDL